MPRPRRRPGAAAPSSREELKMVLVVNGELRMGKGKIGRPTAGPALAAQGGQRDRLHHNEPSPRCCAAAILPIQERSVRMQLSAQWSGCTSGARRRRCSSGRCMGSPRYACWRPPPRSGGCLLRFPSFGATWPTARSPPITCALCWGAGFARAGLSSRRKVTADVCSAGRR